MDRPSPIANRITECLNARFQPCFIELVDESDRHVGHAGHDGMGESHFRLKIVSDAFTGVSRPERHRMVYSALGGIMNIIHALSIKALTEAEK